MIHAILLTTLVARAPTIEELTDDMGSMSIHPLFPIDYRSIPPFGGEAPLFTEENVRKLMIMAISVGKLASVQARMTEDCPYATDGNHAHARDSLELSKELAALTSSQSDQAQFEHAFNLLTRVKAAIEQATPDRFLPEAAKQAIMNTRGRWIRMQDRWSETVKHIFKILSNFDSVQSRSLFSPEDKLKLLTAMLSKCRARLPYLCPEQARIAMQTPYHGLLPDIFKRISFSSFLSGQLTDRDIQILFGLIPRINRLAAARVENIYRHIIEGVLSPEDVHGDILAFLDERL